MCIQNEYNEKDDYAQVLFCQIVTRKLSNCNTKTHPRFLPQFLQLFVGEYIIKDVECGGLRGAQKTHAVLIPVRLQRVKGTTTGANLNSHKFVEEEKKRERG